MKHLKLFEQFVNEMLLNATSSAKQQLLQLPSNTSKKTISDIKKWLKKGTAVEEESMYSEPEAYTEQEIKDAIDTVSKIKSIKRAEAGGLSGIFAEDENGAIYKFQIHSIKSNKVGWVAILQTPDGFKHGAGSPRVTTSGSRTTYTYGSDRSEFYTQSNLEEFIGKVKAIAGIEYIKEAV